MAKKAVFAVVIIFVLIQAASVGAALAAPGNSADDEIAGLSRNIETSQNEIGNLDNQLEVTTIDIIGTYQKLDDQEDLLKQEQQALNNRIGEVYKNYDDVLIGIFLDAQSFNDMWKRFAFLAKINEADTALIQANELRVEQVRRLKEELAVKKQEQVALKRLKQEEYAQLQNSLAQKKALLEAQLKEKQAAISATQAGSSTTSTITSLSTGSATSTF